MVEAVPCVNVVAALLVNEVNAPVLRVDAPMLVLLIVLAAAGLIVNAPAGLIVTVPVPLGLIVTLALAGLNPTVELASSVVNAPVDRVVDPIGVFCKLDASNGWFEVHLPVLCTQLIVLSVAPFRVIPPPLAVVSVGLAVSPNVILISSTLTVVELIVLVVPLTVKLPVITTAPPTFKFSLIPTPPVTTTVPLPVVVLEVLAVNVVAPLLVNVVNAPVERVLAPILVLLMVLAAVGLIVSAPVGLIVTVVAGLIVTLPVPVGDIATGALAGLSVVVPLVVKLTKPVEPPTFKFSLIPTPPVTTSVPVLDPTLLVPAVNVVAPLLVSVVNAPVERVVAPILMLLIVPKVPEVIVIVPAPEVV